MITLQKEDNWDFSKEILDDLLRQGFTGEELEKQFGIKIDKRHIQVSSPIRSTGLIDVPVKIYQDVTGVINIRVNEG